MHSNGHFIFCMEKMPSRFLKAEVQNLSSLILQYKGVMNIPNEVLLASGYKRDAAGRVEKILSAEDIDHILDDLYKVGSAKPLGYLSVDTILACSRDVESVQAELEEKGLCTILLSAEQAGKEADVLYAYDYDALRNLLSSNLEILHDARWPTDPELFILQLKKVVSRDTPLFKLIARAFSDPTEWNTVQKRVRAK